MAIELKPCPLCGSPVKVNSYGFHRKTYSVECQYCNLILGECYLQGEYEGDFDSEQQAADAWNRRA